MANNTPMTNIYGSLSQYASQANTTQSQMQSSADKFSQMLQNAAAQGQLSNMGMAGAQQAYDNAYNRSYYQPQADAQRYAQVYSQQRQEEYWQAYPNNKMSEVLNSMSLPKVKSLTIVSNVEEEAHAILQGYEQSKSHPEIYILFDKSAG
jgi:hypothetical protein